MWPGWEIRWSGCRGMERRLEVVFSVLQHRTFRGRSVLLGGVSLEPWGNVPEKWIPCTKQKQVSRGGVPSQRQHIV